MNIKDLFKYDAFQLDMKLVKDTYRQNESVMGRLFFHFDKLQHKVKAINVVLVLNYFTESRQKKEQVIEKIKVSQGFPTLPYEEKVVDFTYPLPVNLPITSNSLIYTIYIEVEYDKILTKTIAKTIHIVPSVEYQMVLDIMINELQFQPSYRTGLYINQRQIFEFNPRNQFAHRGMQEVVMVIQYDSMYYKINFYYKIHNQKFKNSLTLYKNVLYHFDGSLNKEAVMSVIYQKMEEQLRSIGV